MTLKNFFLLIGIALCACQQAPKSELPTLGITTESETIYLGPIQIKDLNREPYTPWFSEAYQSFKPSSDWVAQHQEAASSVTFYLFMGTWCEDSQREVPGMIRLIEALGKTDALRIYALDEYKQSEDRLEIEWQVEQVPTLIVLKDSTELNRIVEFPIETLENDLGKILRNEPYKNAYAID
ncbi:MAG: TlpA family protein disulfide reductase [Flavobacteriaceae bacterium]